MQSVQEQFLHIDKTARQERNIALTIGFAALLFAALPYLYGYLLTPKGSVFLGQIFSIDDYFVYLSWTKQAADGHFWIHNLFTTDPQGALQFNIFFLIAGELTRWSGQSPETVLQALRLIIAAATLKVCYDLCRLCVPVDRVARLSAFAFVALGSGIGWIHQFKDHDLTRIYPSADSNQPEAFVFMSTYYAALTGLGTLLIAGSMYCLMKMATARRTRYAAAAGFLLLILGNVHTYDVIHVAAAWTLFVIAHAIVHRRVDWPLLSRSILAGVIALPAALNQYYILRHNPVLNQRALQATTLTPAIDSYIIGYGLILGLALVAVRYVAIGDIKTDADTGRSGGRTRVSAAKGIMSLALLCWSIAGLTIIYAVPLAFQRKLIMGEDIPLSILAGIGVSWLTQTLRRPVRRFAVTAIVLLTLPSTLVFVGRDLTTLSRAHVLVGGSESPYLSSGEMETLDWIRTNTNPVDAFIAPPRLALLIPGFADRAVWAGHWGETPKCADKIGRLSEFCAVGASNHMRIHLLHDARARYFCYPNNPKHPSLADMTPSGVTRRYANLVAHPPPYLRRVYHNGEYTVFSVSLH